MPFLDQLYAAAMQLTRDRAATEDLVQETYLRAFDAFATCGGQTGLKAWLFRILADTELGPRTEQQRPRHVSSSTKRPHRRLQAAKHPTFPVPPTAHGQALGRLPDHELKAALQQFPRQFAIVVHLADVEDFSPQQIAGILAIAPNTATSRLHQGRQRLLRLLTDTARQRGFLDLCPDVPSGTYRPTV